MRAGLSSTTIIRSAVCTAALAAALLAGCAGARADESVDLGGGKGVLIRPTGKPRASLILMPGGDGRVNVGAAGSFSGTLGNQLTRTRQAYVAAGFAVLLVDADADLSKAVATMAAIKRPVTVVGTSRGTQRAARGIAAGARPDGLVLTSGFLSDASGDSDNVMNILGSPAALPRTLVVHHRQDACKKTLPAGVEPFQKWAGSKARVVWLSGGVSDGNPCEARAHHGFNGIDGQVVSAVSGFAGR